MRFDEKNTELDAKQKQERTNKIMLMVAALYSIHSGTTQM